MDITIQLAVFTDAPDIATVHMRSWEAAYKDIIPDEYIREKNSGRKALWKKILEGVNTTEYIIKKGGIIVGFIGMGVSRDEDANKETYELKGLYLLPEYFRQGIGTKAMEFVFSKARDLNMKTVIVWLLESNHNAEKFYEKCGFVPDGKTREQNFGKTLNCIRMKRNL